MNKKAPLFLLLLLLQVSVAYGQKTEVFKRLESYHFTPTTLIEHFIDDLAKYQFNTTTTTTINQEKKIKKATYNPSLSLGSRWELDSVDGRIPTPKEIQVFDKNHNQDEQGANGSIIDSTWRIVEETSTYLKVRFRFEKNNLPELFKFLGDCIGYAYFNKKTKQLERAQFINTSPVRFGIFNVKDLEVNLYYKYDANRKSYFVTKEVADLKINLLGKSVVVKDVCIFSNYKKVK